MPREKRDAVLREREILGFLGQSHISRKNLARLRVLGRAENTRIAELARLVLEVGTVTPYRRRRIRTLARERRDVLKRMEDAGLIMPLPPREDLDAWDIDLSGFDPCEIDPSEIEPSDFEPSDFDQFAAWHEWAQFAHDRVTSTEVDAARGGR